MSEDECLVMSLIRNYETRYASEKKIKKSSKVFLRRVYVLREILERRFPGVEIHDPIIIFSWGSIWQFKINSPEKTHIEWAEHASKCGLIDAYAEIVNGK